MPPLPPVSGVLKLQYQFALSNGQKAYSHFYLATSTSTPSTTQLQALAQAAKTNFGTTLAQRMNSAWALNAVEAIDLSATANTPGLSTGTVGGGESGGVLTAETSLLVNFTIGRRYRGGKPRQYWPFHSAPDLLSPTAWAPAAVTATNTQYTAHLNSLLASPTGGPTITSLVSVSYHSNKALRPTPVVDQVLTWSINPIPGSARRRMGR